MSLLDHTDKEYQILSDYLDAIESVEIENDANLHRFNEEVKKDFRRLLSMHFEYNSLKTKYYMCRKKIKELEA